MENYYANGKLLLTGEYLVLHGAWALALPLKVGQSMQVTRGTADTRRLTWQALKPDGIWFEAEVDKDTMRLAAASDPEKGERLATVLQAVRTLNAEAFRGNDIHVVTCLGFDPQWGLGSSSTLVAALAAWARVDPHRLLAMTFGGSGYDLACAKAEGPLLYRLDDGRPVTRPAEFRPAFADRLFFVYQGQKQNSAREVSRFNAAHSGGLTAAVAAVDAVTMALAKGVDFGAFCRLLTEHEAVVARCLSREPLQRRFPDFDGVVKSLGAWGGDFFLAATTWDEPRLRRYFADHGLRTVFAYPDLVL